jgi:SpoVK/Ycf46/Vps4 family AAA+-type ATPase
MLLRSEADRIISSGGAANLDDDQLYVLGRALQGLTYNEARHAIRRAAASDKSLSIEVIPLLLEEKRLLIGKTGLIEYIPDPTPLSQLGGLDNLKNWLQERHKLFQQRESISHEIIPKGVLMMGISGCGKSLSVKVIASAFDLPLYRLDMIQIFSGSVGNPEHAFVEACKTMEEIAPAVLWFDEIETSISANAAEASGILGRIFGFFLTWMQEKSPGLFVAATANRIDLLPAEMIRKGRFDQVFFIDLPTPAERVEILRIHLLKRGVNPDPLNMELFAKLTDGWTGAEVEQCVIGAMVSAQLNDRPVDNNDLFFSCKQIVPLSKTMKEQLNHIRSWAFERAIRASSRT